MLLCVLAGPAQPRYLATCTAKQKSSAQAALVAYRKAMPKQRAAYYKKHKQAVQRKRFVKKQQARLKALTRAAACRVSAPRVTPPAPRPSPAPPALPTPQLPPPPPPSALPAVERTPPTLQSANVSGGAINLAFDEPIGFFGDASVTVDGAPAGIAGVAFSGASVSVTLAAATDGDDVVLISARVQDAAGNETKLRLNAVTNTAATGFAPALAKASWADIRSADIGSAPEFGEWPIDHAYFLPATRVRILLLFVDQPSKPLRWPPQKTYETWAAITPRWERLSSYGRLDVQLDRTDRVYRLSKDDYGELHTGGRGGLRELIAEATQLADADVDFSKYDAVWVVGETGVGARQFRPWPEEALIRDGKPILHAELVDDFLVEQPVVADWTNGHVVDSAGATHNVLTHELGHHMGLPDTSYKPNPETPYDFTRVAGWDLQDNPAGMFPGGDYFAWNKQRLGWIDPVQIRGLTAPGVVETTLSPVETAGGVKLIVAQTSPSFLYAVEVRRHFGNDAASVCDEGVLVYTVDSTKRNGEAPKFVHEAQRGSDPDKVSRCGLKYAAPFDVGPGEVSTFEDASVKIEVLATDGVNYRVRVRRK